MSATVYTANGSIKNFSYYFKVLQAIDIDVRLGGRSQIYHIDYVVRGVGRNEGGTVEFTQAPSAGSKITIARDIGSNPNSDQFKDAVNKVLFEKEHKFLDDKSEGWSRGHSIKRLKNEFRIGTLRAARIYVSWYRLQPEDIPF